MNLVFTQTKKGLQALPITGSRGCVRNCTFCDVNAACVAPNFSIAVAVALQERLNIKCKPMAQLHFVLQTV